MDGSVPIFFLMVVLKVPVAMLLYLVWWSLRAMPDVEEAPGGSDDHEFRRWNRPKPGPRGPRRGPHAPDARPLPDCPPGGRKRAPRVPAVEPVRAGARSRGSAARV